MARLTGFSRECRSVSNNALANHFAFDGDRPGRRNPNSDLVSFDLDNGHGNIFTDPDCLADASVRTSIRVSYSHTRS